MRFKEFIEFQGLFQKLTGTPLTQEQIDVYEKWYDEKTHNIDKEELIFSIGEAIYNLDSAWEGLSKYPDVLSNIKYSELWSIFEKTEQTRNFIETFDWEIRKSNIVRRFDVILPTHIISGERRMSSLSYYKIQPIWCNSGTVLPFSSNNYPFTLSIHHTNPLTIKEIDSFVDDVMCMNGFIAFDFELWDEFKSLSPDDFMEKAKQFFKINYDEIQISEI